MNLGNIAKIAVLSIVLGATATQAHAYKRSTKTIAGVTYPTVICNDGKEWIFRARPSDEKVESVCQGHGGMTTGGGNGAVAVEAAPSVTLEVQGSPIGDRLPAGTPMQAPQFSVQSLGQ